MENYEAWNLDEAVDYYNLTRNKPEDVYESERVFFFPLIKKVNSVLDVGCGAGGFYEIIRTINPKVKYTGVDTSERMIESAKRRFPGIDFRLTSGKGLDFSSNSFDMVFSLGVIHHVPEYRDFIKECYRISKRYCLLDLPRLLPHPHRFDIKNSYMILKKRFHSKKKMNDVQAKVPYVLVDAAEMFNLLLNDLKPKRILAKGYYGRCHKSVTLPVEEVCFTVICIDKLKGGNGKIIADLPRSILERLKKKKIDFTEPFEWVLK